ncbi:MAG: Ig-like domain-containing protein [Eubacterium sp.]
MKKLHIKKVLAMFLAVALVVPSSASNLTASAATTQESNDESAIPEGYTPIYDAADLYAIRNNLEGNYIMMADIDLSEATAPGGELDTGNGWNPIQRFTGTLDGNGHYIKGLTIYGDPKTYNVGLFDGLNSNPKICNLGMVDVNINIVRDSSGSYYSKGCDTAALVADGSDSWYAEIENCFVTGQISSNVGSISGISTTGRVENVYNLAQISYTSDTDSVWTAGIVMDYDSRAKCTYNRGEINNGVGNSKNGYPMRGDGRWDYCEYNYYLQGNSADDDKATPLTETQMKNSKFYTGFDFENTWFIDPYSNYPYPQLRSCPQKRINSIEVTKQPNKTVYQQGENFDFTGATLHLIYENGLEQDVLLTKDMIGSYDMNKIGKQSIPISYCGIAETSLDITVKETAVDKVQLNKSQINLYKGKTETLSAAITPSNASNKQITWSVVKGDCVTVDNNGTITANKKGTATVRATSANGKYADCVVTVQVPCILLQLTNTNIKFKKGETKSISDTIGYVMSPLDCTDSVTWKSSNDKVLQINNNETMLGLAAGKVTVTGTTTSGTTAVANVTVQRDMSEFTVTGVSNKYYTGKAIKPKFAVSDGTTTLKENEDYNVTYESNTNVGTANIKITGIDPYVGTIEQSFQILPVAEEITPDDSSSGNGGSTITAPAKVKIRKLTAAKKKLTVTWKKVAGARGYRIQIARNRAFTKSLKTYNVSAKTSKKVFSRLKKKTTYYVRINAFCNDEDGNKLVGKYSTVKKKKTK